MTIDLYLKDGKFIMRDKQRNILNIKITQRNETDLSFCAVEFSSRLLKKKKTTLILHKGTR